MTIWIIAGCVVLLAVLRGIFPLLVMAERQNLRPLARIADDHPKTKNATSERVIDAAKGLGYIDAGVYTDGDKGWKEGIVTLLVSPDARVLLCVHHAAAVRRHRLLTRMMSGRWVITSSPSGTRDWSGVTDSEMFPSQHFGVTLRYHFERIDERIGTEGGDVILFTPAEAAADLFELERERQQALIERGFARAITARPGDTSLPWRYTVKGAFKAGSLPSMSDTKRQVDLVKVKEEQWAFAKG